MGIKLFIVVFINLIEPTILMASERWQQDRENYFLADTSVREMEMVPDSDEEEPKLATEPSENKSVHRKFSHKLTLLLEKFQKTYQEIFNGLSEDEKSKFIEEVRNYNNLKKGEKFNSCPIIKKFLYDIQGKISLSWYSITARFQKVLTSDSKFSFDINKTDLISKDQVFSVLVKYSCVLKNHYEKDGKKQATTSVGKRKRDLDNGVEKVKKR